MGTSTDCSAVEAKGLRFSYPGEAEVLRGLSIRIAHGERVGIAGPNGAGKTTFLRLLCGLLNPGSGSLEVGGNEVIPGRFDPGLAMVFQDPDNQLFCPSVKEDVSFGPSNMGLSAGSVEAMADRAMNIASVRHLAERPPHHLSAGEKRMVTLAGALAMEPELLLCDEPSACLDHSSRRRLIQVLSEETISVIVASHDLELILEVCPRTVIMSGGQVVADGPSAEVLGDAILLDGLGMEVPYSIIRGEPVR